MKKTLPLSIAVCSVFLWHDGVAQTLPEADFTDNAGNVNITDGETTLVEAEGGNNIFIYSPPPEEFRLGCDIPREDNLRSIMVAYSPSTEQLYFKFTAAAVTSEGLAPHNEGEDLGGNGTLIEGIDEDDLEYQNAFWTTISAGDEPQSGRQEYAIIYADIESQRVAFYAHDASDPIGSYNEQPFLGSAENAIEVTRENGYQTISMLIDVEDINNAFNNSEWIGTQFGEKFAMWMQGGFNSEVSFSTAARGLTATSDGEGSSGGSTPLNSNGATVSLFSLGEDSAWHDSPFIEEGNTIIVSLDGDGMEVIHSPSGNLTDSVAFSTPSSSLGGSSLQAAEDGTILTKEQFEQAAAAAGIGEADELRFGNIEERKKSYVWCTLLGNIVTVTPEAINAWVIGPRWGFVDENTLEVECLGDLKIGIQTSDFVTGITAVHPDGRELDFIQQDEDKVAAEMKALEEQYGMSILDAAQLSNATSIPAPEGGGVFWVLNNGGLQERRFFDYGTHNFSLKITTSDGDEHTIEHDLILPRAPWPARGR